MSGSALIISLASLIVSAFQNTEITNVLIKYNEKFATISMILVIISIIFILVMPIYSKKIYIDSDKIFKKRKILNICLELLENYEKQYESDMKLFIDDNKRSYKVTISEK